MHLLLQIKPVIREAFHFKLENLSFTKLAKNINKACYIPIKLRNVTTFKPLIKGNVKYTK